MNKKGPIVLIENNPEDLKLFKQIFSELKILNKVLCFDSAKDAYSYINTKRKKALLMLSDIALLNMNDGHVIQKTYKELGMELKCPCLFFTTAYDQSFVIDLYSVPPQSYVIKPYNYNKFKQVIKTVIEYWSNIKSIEDYKSDPLKRNNIQNNLN
jgi:response regulator of citrate/malate metabolism